MTNIPLNPDGTFPQPKKKYATHTIHAKYTSSLAPLTIAECVNRILEDCEKLVNLRWYQSKKKLLSQIKFYLEYKDHIEKNLNH